MLIDAFDTLVHAETMLAKLRDAQKLIARKQLTEEKQWLQTAVERLAAAVAAYEGLASRCAQLPELEPVRGELAKSVQNAAIDAVERLQAGITFHAGPRSPVLEELFGAYKLPALRRAARDEFEKFTGSFGKRLKAQYIKRLLASDEYAPVQGAVAAVTQSFDAWRAAFSPEALPEADADKLRAQLTVAADSLQQPVLQARLLAEAALLPVDGAFLDSGLAAKPRKRAVAKPAVASDVAEDPPAAAVESAPAAEVIAAKGKGSKSKHRSEA